MKSFRRRFSLAACLVVLLSPRVAECASQKPAPTGGSFAVTIDGNSPWVKSVEGGYAIADIVTDAAMTGPLRKKHVTNIGWAPITIKVGDASEPWLVEIINDFLTGKNTLHTVTVADESGAIEARNAALTEVDFPGLDGASKDPFYLTLVFAPEQVRSLPKAGNPASTGGVKVKAMLVGNYSFALPGVATNRVATIGALNFKRALSSSANGMSHGTEPTSAPLEMTNLVLTNSLADLDGWHQWSQDFLLNGNHLDANEKTAQINLLGPDLKTVLMTLQFEHVGLVRVTPPSLIANSTIPRFEAELYFEGVSVVSNRTDAKAVSQSAPAASSPGTTAPTSNGTETASTATPTDPSAATGATSTEGTSATAPSTTIPTPLADSGSGLNPPSPTTAPQATGGATAQPVSLAGRRNPTKADSNIDDLGARDPEAIPRIDGLVRTEFRSSKRESSEDESASYAAKITPAVAASAYASAFKGTGWEEITRIETGDEASSNHYIRMQMKRPLETAEVRISQTKTKGSDISVSFYSSRAAILTAVVKAQAGINADLAPATGSPNDLGAADPANFPRIAGSIRKAYRSSGSKDARQEDVTYRAKLSVAQAQGFFINRLTQTDWELSEVREAGDPGGATHQFTLLLRNGRRNVTLFLKEIEPQITEINAVLGVDAP